MQCSACRGRLFRASEESSGACKPVAATGGGGGRWAEQPGRKRRCTSSIAPESHDRDGHSHPCCSAFVPIARRPRIGHAARDARTPAAPAVHVLPNGRATRPSTRRSRVAKTGMKRRHEVVTDEPIVGAPGSATSPPPWRAPRWCSMVAVCLRPPNLTARCRRPAFEPPAPDPARELYERASDALHATHQLAVASGTPGSAAAVAPALASTEASLDALAWQWTRCAASSSASALLRVLSHVGDSATAPPSSTSASL